MPAVGCKKQFGGATSFGINFSDPERLMKIAPEGLKMQRLPCSPTFILGLFNFRCSEMVDLTISSKHLRNFGFSLIDLQGLYKKKLIFRYSTQILCIDLDEKIENYLQLAKRHSCQVLESFSSSLMRTGHFEIFPLNWLKGLYWEIWLLKQSKE